MAGRSARQWQPPRRLLKPGRATACRPGRGWWSLPPEGRLLPEQCTVPCSLRSVWCVASALGIQIDGPQIQSCCCNCCVLVQGPVVEAHHGIYTLDNSFDIKKHSHVVDLTTHNYGGAHAMCPEADLTLHCLFILYQYGSTTHFV